MTPADLIRLGTNMCIDTVIKYRLNEGKSYKEIAIEILRDADLLQSFRGVE